MIIRWIPESRIADLYDELASQGLADPGAELVEDIIACPGTDTCGLGITSSKGLARALAEVFPAGRVPEDLKESMSRSAGATTPAPNIILPRSGCMESGSVSATTSRRIYELHLGGPVNGTAKIGQMIVKLPAKACRRRSLI